MAAHLEGKGVITQDSAGLAQKGGSTWSHIQIANRAEAIRTTKVDTAKADLVIGCDPIVAANKATLAVMHAGHTFVALNTHGTPTAAFVKNPEWQFPGGAVRGRAGPRGGRRSRRRLRRGTLEHAAARRLDLHQSDAARLCLAARPRAAHARGAAARHRAERRAGREQQGRLRVGPPRRARPRGGALAHRRGAGDPVREEARRSTT